jgi:hypothetical protein
MPTTVPIQPSLFTADQCPPAPPPPRPTQNDPAVIDAALARIWPEIVAWGIDEDDEDSKGSIREGLDGHHLDGYAFARSLEHDGWDPDSQLVEILDGASHHLHTAHDKAVAAWVAEHGWPGVRLPVGTRVRAKVGSRMVEGEVSQPEHGAERYDNHAHYLLWCPSEGHVKAGCGSHGFIVNAESVEVLK